MRIFIDAGHNDSGSDTGAQGNRLREQDITYSISQKLGALLSKNFDIMYSRPNKTDNLGLTVSQSINKRILMANQWQANLYISIHCNAVPDHSANGTETLIFAKGGQAESLASHVQNNLISTLGTFNRGVKTQNVGVLRETSMPAILVETAFITNESDSQLLVNRQDDIAQAIANGIFEFLGVKMDVSKNNYYTKDGIHFRETLIADYKIQYWDKPKRTSSVSNYGNLGYFGKFLKWFTFYTIPVANLCADIDVNTLNKYARETLNEIAKFENGKVFVDCRKNVSKQFLGKYPSTLVIYDNNTADILPLNALPNNAKYAVSGAPIILNGKDASWERDVKPQGWDGSIVRATWHTFLTVKDGKVFQIGVQTKTSNCFTSSEVYNKLKWYGFNTVIKVDGGTSFIYDNEGKNVAVTSGNAIINNIGLG